MRIKNIKKNLNNFWKKHNFKIKLFFAFYFLFSILGIIYFVVNFNPDAKYYVCNCDCIRAGGFDNFRWKCFKFIVSESIDFLAAIFLLPSFFILFFT